MAPSAHFFRALGLGVLIIILGSDAATAGVLYARRPGTETPVYPLAITKIRTSVRIEGYLAVTHVDEEFYNDNGMTLEGFYAFKLPEGARVDGLWLWVDGKRLTFIVKKKEEAQRLYDSVVIGQRKDPALLEDLGQNRFQLKVFPIAPHGARRIEIQYFETLQLTPDGYAHYAYPLNMKNYQSVPAEFTDLQIDVRGHLPITHFRTSFDDRPTLNRVSRIDASTWHVDFGLENQLFSEDYLLSFALDGADAAFPALSWRNPDSTMEDPYFMCWHGTPGSQTNAARDLVFVLDASGSMAGERIAAVRSAMSAILPQLQPEDRFRIVLFSTFATVWPADSALLPATAENIQRAIEYINREYIEGGTTNYEAAFTAALAGGFRANAERRMLFLTDGTPTTGATTYTALLKVITDHDAYGVRIFPLLFYTSSITLLYDIADARGGKTTTVDSGDDLAVIIARIMLDLGIAGVADPEVRYLNGTTYRVQPRSFPRLVSADRIITCGRYSGDGAESVEFRCTAADGQPILLRRDVRFDDWMSSLKEVAAYWAAARIDEILDAIKTYGELPELKDEVIALSIRHQILTPYTAFLVLETNRIDPPLPVDRPSNAPGSCAISSIHPNPCSISTASRVAIGYTVSETTHLTIAVTDVLGRVLRILSDAVHAPGTFQVVWDGLVDGQGKAVPGMYFIRIVTPNQILTRKLVLLR